MRTLMVEIGNENVFFAEALRMAQSVSNKAQNMDRLMLDDYAEFREIFTPNRMALLETFAGHELPFKEIAERFAHRPYEAIFKDVRALENYGVLTIRKAPNEGHGQQNIVEIPQIFFAMALVKEQAIEQAQTEERQNQLEKQLRSSDVARIEPLKGTNSVMVVRGNIKQKVAFKGKNLSTFKIAASLQNQRKSGFGSLGAGVPVKEQRIKEARTKANKQRIRINPKTGSLEEV